MSSGCYVPEPLTRVLSLAHDSPKGHANDKNDVKNDVDDISNIYEQRQSKACRRSKKV